MHPSTLIAVFLFLLAPAGAAAQSVTGVVTAAAGVPVPGAVVVALDEGGGRTLGTLTDARGGYRLDGLAPGRYRLRVERIGFASVTSGDFRLDARQTLALDLVASEAAVELEGIEVAGRRRCVARPGSGPGTLRLWEEARKVLTSVALAGEMGVIEFLTERFRRDLDLRGNVLGEERFALRVHGDQPFRAPPVQLLLREGFVRRQGGDHVYAGPDATTLLAPEFLDAHCFHVTAGEGGLVGLAFEPLPERRGISGISGVLWLERATARLSHVEFRYTRVPVPARAADFGGRVEFSQLDAGPWYVSRWSLRMPYQEVHVPSLSNPGQRILVREVGGEVRAAAARGTGEGAPP